MSHNVVTPTTNVERSTPTYSSCSVQISSYVHTSPVRTKPYRQEPMSQAPGSERANRTRVRTRVAQQKKTKKKLRRCVTLPIFKNDTMEGVPFVPDRSGESQYQLQMGISPDGIPIKEYLPQKTFYNRPFSRSKRREQASTLLLGFDVHPSLPITKMRQLHERSLTVPLRLLRPNPGEEEWSHFSRPATSTLLRGPHTASDFTEATLKRSQSNNALATLEKSRVQVRLKNISQLYEEAHLHTKKSAQQPFEPVVDEAKLMALYKNRKLLRSCPLLPVVPAAPGKNEMPLVPKSAFFLTVQALKQASVRSLRTIKRRDGNKNEKLARFSAVNSAHKRNANAPTYSSRRIFGIAEYNTMHKSIRGKSPEPSHSSRDFPPQRTISTTESIAAHKFSTSETSEIININGEDVEFPIQRPLTPSALVSSPDVSMSVSIKRNLTNSSILSQNGGNQSVLLTEVENLGFQDVPELSPRIAIKEKIIQVYICSDGYGFVGEREFLFKSVFPRLNKVTSGLGVCVVPVDMNVVKEDKLPIDCRLEEIEKSSIFVVLQGYKCGPPENHVEQLKEYFGAEVSWLKELGNQPSVMEIELMFALSRVKKRNEGGVCAYFRDNSCLAPLNNAHDDVKHVFLPIGVEEIDRSKRSKIIRELLDRNAYASTHTYSCKYIHGKEVGEPGKMEMLDDFGEQVLQNLIGHVCTGQISGRPMSPLAVEERSQHRLLRRYEKKPFVLSSKRVLRETIENQIGVKPVVILGDHGSGKTTFAVWLHLHFVPKEQFLTLTFFSQASAKASSALHMMKYMLFQMQQLSCGALQTEGDTLSEPHSSLKQIFLQSLLNFANFARTKSKRVVMIMDGIDNFSSRQDAESGYLAEWLPSTLPSNMLIILTAAKDSVGTNWIFERYENRIYTILTEETMVEQTSRKKIIMSSLDTYKRSWNSSDISAIMKNKKLSNPRLVHAYIQAIRKCKHDKKNKKVDKSAVMRTLPVNMHSLQLHIFSRLESEFDLYIKLSGMLPIVDTAFERGRFPLEDNIRGRPYAGVLLERLLGTIYCSRCGIERYDLSVILFGHHGTHQEYAAGVLMTQWVLSEIRTYFPDTTVNLPLSRFSLFPLTDTIKTLYVYSLEAEVRHYKLLAHHYAYKKKSLGVDIMSLLDLPYYQMRAFDLVGLRQTLCDLKYIELCCKQNECREIESNFPKDAISNYSLILRHLNSHSYLKMAKHLKGENIADTLDTVRREIGDFLSFLQQYSVAMRNDSSSWFQLAVNMPTSFAPNIQVRAMINSLSSAVPTNGWFEWLNKPSRHSIAPVYYVALGKGDITTVQKVGQLFLVGHSDGKLYMVNQISGDVIQSFLTNVLDDHPAKYAFMLAYGTFVVTISNRKLFVWDTGAGVIMFSKEFEHDVFSSCVAPINSEQSYQLFFVGSGEGGIQCWQQSCTKNGVVAISCKSKVLLPAESVATSMTYSQSLKSLVIGCSNSCLRIYANSNTALSLRREIPVVLAGEIKNVCINNSATLIACSGTKSRSIYVFEIIGIPLCTLQSYYSHIASLAWASEENALISSSIDGRTLLWNMDKREAQVVDSSFTCVVHSSFGKNDDILIADKHFVKEISLTNLRLGDTGSSTACKKCVYHHAHVRDAHPTQIPLSYLDGGSLGVHAGDILCGAFSNSSHRIVTGCSAGQVSVWNYASKSDRHILLGDFGLSTEGAGISTVTFSPDDRYIACGCVSGDIYLWDGSSHKFVVLLKWQTSAITAVSFSKNSDSLISGCVGGVVQKWDTQTGRYIEHGSDMSKLNGMHNCPVVFARFVSNESRIVTVGEYGDIRVFEANTLQLINLCTDLQSSFLFKSAKTAGVDESDIYALTETGIVFFSVRDLLTSETSPKVLDLKGHISKTKSELQNRLISNSTENTSIAALKEHLNGLENEVQKLSSANDKEDTKLVAVPLTERSGRYCINMFDLNNYEGESETKIIVDVQQKGIRMERWSVGGEGQDMNRTLEDPVEFKTYGKITSLGVCPLDDDIVFCGDSLGHVYILKLCNGSKKRLDEPNVE